MMTEIVRPASLVWPFELSVLKSPVLMICGHGRAGKDTAAEYLRDHAGIKFEGGCSWAARHYMAGRLGISAEEAYARRHEDRELWFRYLNELRADDRPSWFGWSWRLLS